MTPRRTYTSDELLVGCGRYFLFMVVFFFVLMGAGMLGMWLLFGRLS